MRVLNRCFERGVVELGQRPRGHDLVQPHPRGLLGVAGEVFGIGHHASRLDPFDAGDSENAGQVRVLAESLEDPTALRNPGQVELGSLDDVDSLGAGLGSHDLAGGARDRWIETGGDSDCRGQLRDAAKPVGDAVWTVREDQRRNAQRGYAAVGVLDAVTAAKYYEGGLLSQRHPGEHAIGQCRVTREVELRIAHPRASGYSSRRLCRVRGRAGGLRGWRQGGGDHCDAQRCRDDTVAQKLRV